MTPFCETSLHPSRCLQIMVDSWHRQFILSMKVQCYVFFWIYLSFQKYILHNYNPLIVSSNFFFQSHTRVAMAMAFQKMLKQFSLTEKIHVVNADNASAIDKQTKLAVLDNSFKKRQLCLVFQPHNVTPCKDPPCVVMLRSGLVQFKGHFA